jgi:hypothetical protein
MNVAATLLAVTEEQIVEYFQKKGAVSPSTAIPLNIQDLKAHVDVPEFTEESLHFCTFLVQTSSGRYYLDQALLTKNYAILKIVLGAMALLILISVLVSLIPTN